MMFLVLLLFLAQAPGPELQGAISALQRGEFAAAEQQLRAEVKAHPSNAWALSLLGAALDSQGRPDDAAPFHRRAAEAAPSSVPILSNYAAHLWRAGQIGEAANIYTHIVGIEPANYDANLQLARVALSEKRADDAVRAIERIPAERRSGREAVDLLYAAALADYEARRFEAALSALAQASKLDAKRADVLRLLATVAADVGALDDASAAWDRYLTLRPDDAVARRERAYTRVQMGRAEEALPELAGYAGKFPNDPAGHYELGQAERTRDLAKALAEFDRALAIDPQYVPALSARAAVYNQQGEPEKAVADLERVAAMRPTDAAALDRLGQTYQALDRTADALRVLRRAAELAPDDSKTLLHLARALAESGAVEESKQVMDRFRRLGAEKRSGVPPGFVEYLSLPAEQRRAAHRAKVEKALREHPDDAALRVEQVKLLLSDGKTGEAVAAARRLAEGSRAEGGRALLAAGQYAAAAELLPEGIERVVAQHLARGEVEQAIAAAPERPDVYRAGAVALVGRGQFGDAAKVLARAPKSRELELLRAVAEELAGDSRAADETFAAIRAQAPEWAQLWAAQGMVLARRRSPEAQRVLETAIALGGASAEVYYYLAATASDAKTAQAAAQQAARLAPDDPWIKALAARTKAPAGAPPYLQSLFK